jgi:hypothetical protein
MGWDAQGTPAEPQPQPQPQVLRVARLQATPRTQVPSMYNIPNCVHVYVQSNLSVQRPGPHRGTQIPNLDRTNPKSAQPSHINPPTYLPVTYPSPLLPARQVRARKTHKARDSKGREKGDGLTRKALEKRRSTLPRSEMSGRGPRRGTGWTRQVSRALAIGREPAAGALERKKGWRGIFFFLGGAVQPGGRSCEAGFLKRGRAGGHMVAEGRPRRWRCATSRVSSVEGWLWWLSRRQRRLMQG